MIVWMRMGKVMRKAAQDDFDQVVLSIHSAGAVPGLRTGSINCLLQLLSDQQHSKHYNNKRTNNKTVTVTPVAKNVPQGYVLPERKKIF